MQEYQPAAQIVATHSIFQMVTNMSWIILVLVRIDPWGLSPGRRDS